MSVQEDKATIKIALKYYNDNVSLKKSVEQAQAEVAKMSGKDIKSANKASAAELEQAVKRASMVTKKGLAETGNAFQRFGAQFQNFYKKLGQIASYGAAYKAIQLLTQGVKHVITTTIEYEKAFISLQAKAGLTTKELNKIRAAIIDVASITEFSTLAITDMATEMSKLGFAAEEVIEVLPTVAKVASATGAELVETGKSIGKVLNTYNKLASDAVLVGDRMVQSFNESALNLEKFTTAFGYVGAAAAASGTSFDEITASMQILADRGVTASKMGTGLRNIFIKLTESGESLSDVLKRISEENLEFTQTAELVGKRAATQLHILADAYDEFREKATNANEGFGAAMEKAAITQSSIAARWDIAMNNMNNFFAKAVQFSEDWRDNVNLGLFAWGSEFFSSFWESWDDQSSRLSDQFVARSEEFREEYMAIAEAEPDATPKEILALMGLDSFFRSSTERALIEKVGESMDDYYKAIDDEVSLKREENWLNQIKKNAKSIKKIQGSEAADNYIKSLMGLNNPFALSRFGTDDVGVDKQLSSLLDKDTGDSYWKDKQEQLKEVTVSMKNILATAGDDHSKLSKTNYNIFKTAKDKAKALNDEACSELGTVLATSMGFTCKETKGGRRQKAFKFDGIERAGFENRLLGEDDPAERIKILEEYSNAYAKAAREYIKVSTDIERSKGAEDSSAMFGVGINKRIVREQEILLKESTVNLKDYYKKDVVAYAEFTRDLKKLAAEEDLAIGTKNKAAKRAEMIALNQQFFATQKANLSVAIMDLEEMVVSMESKLRFEDAEKLQAYIDKLRAEIIKLEGQLGLTVSDGKKDDPNKPPTRDQIISEALNTASTLASIQEQINEEKLRVLEEQADAELKIIEDRYDDEQTFTDAALKAGIVSQEQAQRAEEAANKRRIDAQNKVNKKLFEERKKAEEESILIQGIIQAAQVIASSIAQYGPIYGAVIGGVGAALIGVQTSMALSAKSKEKYTPIAYAEGGMVEGRSHAEGGVPFSVKGQGGYEMEGGEYIVNKKAVSDNFALLEAINGKTQGTQKVFAAGGIVEEVSNTPEQDIMFALLNALDRPVRAYVTDQDLARSESERRALEVKTNY